VLPDMEFITPDGFVAAKDLTVGQQMTSLSGRPTTLAQFTVLPPYERDIIEVHLATGGSFTVTADRFFLARNPECLELSPVSAGELRKGMLLVTSKTETVIIEGITKLPRCVGHVEFELAPASEVALVNVHGQQVGILGSHSKGLALRIDGRPGKFLDIVEHEMSDASKRAATAPEPRSCGHGQSLIIELQPKLGATCRGSQGHKQGTCVGACNFHKGSGCKFGMSCNLCHVPGCNARQRKPGKQQHKRRAHNSRLAS